MSVSVFALVLLAATLHACWNFAARKVAGNMSVIWLGLCVASLLSWPLAFLAQRTGPPMLDAWPYMLITGVVHAAYFTLLGWSYGHGDISVIYPVARGTGVLGTTLVASAVLGECLSLAGVLGIAAICTGTLWMGGGIRYRPEQWRAYLQAFAVGAMIMVYSVTDKLAVAHVHPLTYISAMFSLSALLLAPYILYDYRPACRVAWRSLKRYIAIIGIGSMGTYLLILFAFRHGQVSHIVAIREVAVVLAACLGFVALHEPCTPQKAFGIGAITIGLVLLKLA